MMGGRAAGGTEVSGDNASAGLHEARPNMTQIVELAAELLRRFVHHGI